MFWVPTIMSFVFLITSLILNRVSAQQTNLTQTTATLSQARYQLAATSSGDLVFFGGGQNVTGLATSQVDICNVTSGIWTTSTLSVPRYGVAATSSGNLVFFAGGWNGTIMPINYPTTIDIYNVTTGNWTVAITPIYAVYLAATSVSNVALFGGGGFVADMAYQAESGLFLYFVNNNTLVGSSLPVTSAYLAATSVGDLALFGGGFGLGALSNVTLFNASTGNMSTAQLSQARGNLAATSLGNLAFFAGGKTNANQSSDVVDIFNLTSQTWSTARLSQPRYYLAAASAGDIVAFGGGWNGSAPSAVVDIYNVTNGLWYLTNLSLPRYYLAAASTANKIFFGGGMTTNGYSNVVDIFCLDGTCSLSVVLVPTPPPPPTSPPPLMPPPPPPSTSPLPMGPSSSSLPSPNSTPSSTFVPQGTLNSPSSMFTTPTTPLFPLASSHSPVSLTIIPSASNFFQENLPAVVGIVVGLVALLIGIGFVLFLVLFIKRRKQKQRKFNKNMSSDSAQTHSPSPPLPPLPPPPSSDPHENRNAFELTNRTTSSTPSESMLSYQMSMKRWQIAFNDIVVEKEVGEGSYGKVCLGKWNAASVALKFCRKNRKIEDFLQEMKIMIELPPHPNVVQVLGLSVDGPQPIIVMEFCPGGSLDTLLYDSNVNLNEEDKMQLIRGIAAGMLHLHKHNIVHRDLAARNILLTASGDPKISDFGMSRLLEGTNEAKTSYNIGPIRWMAPESLKRQVYSKYSDVWSFGIVVYEIVAECEPHIDVDPIDIGPMIRDKYVTPKIPIDCPEKLRQLMKLCWKKRPDQRPVSSYRAFRFTRQLVTLTS